MKTKTTYDKRDKAIESVLQYLINYRYGYMRDLEKLNEPEIISELQENGILKIGYSSKDETYSLTQFGIKYCDVVGVKGKSVICRLFNGLVRVR